MKWKRGSRMTRIKLTGINRVKKKRADGNVVEMHYAWRGKGAPCFWRSDSDIKIGSAEYVAALAEAAPKGSIAKGKFREILLAWINSQDFAKLAARTQADMRKSIYHTTNGIDVKFGDAPAAAFDDPRIRKKVLDWRDTIGGKVGDDRVRHLQRIVGFALDRGMLMQHRLQLIRSVYQSNRAEVLWTPEEVEMFEAGAPKHVSRILIAATETGLRPGDLLMLSRQHIHPTPKGRRIVLWTRKGKAKRRVASIPLTERMATLVDQTPEHQDRIIVTKGGTPYTHENYLGDAVSEWRDRLSMRKALRLYDARGTAATRLLAAGCELGEIATHMGWSIKHATEVIERYVALSPGMTDQVSDRLREAEARTKLQTGVQTGQV